MAKSPPGPVPPAALRPTDIGELRAAIADTARTHPRLRIAGAGTAAGWAAPPEPADMAVDLTGMSGVLAYNPTDMTIAVRAGTRLDALQDKLSKNRQHVAFDAARLAEGATIGGLLATADGGPRRHLYGTLRDLVIGATVVLADGTIARSGGHVIKNVAGYDLAKLFHGSFGTLGVVAEVVLRLHPAPRATATARVPGTAEQAAEAAGRIVTAGLEPTAIEWVTRDGGVGDLLVRLDGTPRGVPERATAIARRTGLPAEILAPEAADELWRTVAGVATGIHGDTVLRIGTLPSSGPRLANRVTALAGEFGVGAALTSSIGVGVHTVRLRAGPPTAHQGLLTALHREAGSAVTVLRRDGLGAAPTVWGPPPPSIRVMRAVKQQFDPHGRFGAGRLAPWLESQARTEEQSL